MRLLRQLSARCVFATVLVSAACTDGDGSPLRVVDGGADTTNPLGSSGSGGSTAGRDDGPPDPFPSAGSGAGAGAGGGDDVWAPCAGDPSSEDVLVTALNRAIADGKFCLRHQLTVREELRCDAYRLVAPIALASTDAASGSSLASWVPMVVGWHVVADGSGRAWWASLEAANVNDARDAMLSEDSKEICETVPRVDYRLVAVAHTFNSWVVELAPDMP